ncbi:ABC transporter ATP-binding protein [Bifidobacterium subtile]|uniref:Nitrate/sulfonate/bicarbonate ABC transporter ATPase n=1 Tax=Bifidobacterium subtile TaxID=77635 RepID=A0A087EAK0_9BIFI|nr:ABC transporter ATP-binding protein [Bifidobacterium subtile]KFJ04801.1 nitrate/sulfonate/bicarbonate ABC transporter ATPase [Bifidobacterium subtile]QOL35872.1 ABC transporter ATP-binding protein [Bifidobacterium subtile]
MTKTNQSELVVKDVVKQFQTKSGLVTALSETSCTINGGEFITLLGPSGCGKSTLLRIIGGLETITQGSVTFDGVPTTGPSRERGMVFQSYTLFPWLTVEENITFGLDLESKGSSKERKEVAHRYLDLIGLSDFAKKYPTQLSGGMKQRVAIARALAAEPKMLLMDEPFGALDAQTRLLMQEMLLKIWEGTNKTIVFVTHDVDEAIFLGDRVFVMSSRPGRVKRIQPVPFPRPRQYELKRTQEFVDLSISLTDELREESSKMF